MFVSDLRDWLRSHYPEKVAHASDDQVTEVHLRLLVEQAEDVLDRREAVRQVIQRF
jgi:hypothetical protein